MARTRKRDDDSHCNSDATSLAALDACSMSAAGSRSSLTFASSTKVMSGKHPRKRQRKSLTDALQSISLDKDKGVPEQILSSKIMLGGGDFPFSNCGSSIRSNGSAGIPFSAIVNNNTIQNGFATIIGGISSPLNGVPNFSHLNSKQHADRLNDRGGEGDGDIYYDDDNSQLTSSTIDNDHVADVEVDGMDDEFDEDEDGDEDSHRKRLADMTDFEKAQRKVMLDLVFGKDHSEVRKEPDPPKPDYSDREVSSCMIPQTPPSSSVPPFATMSTTAPTTICTKGPCKKESKEQGKNEGEHFKDPADRKIEELLRRSLKNLQEGTHPFQLKITNDDNDAFSSTPWKTQDDMAIDPDIYSPRIQALQQQKMHPLTSLSPAFFNTTATTTNHSMTLDSNDSSNNIPMKNTPMSHLQSCPFRRQRSNSLPGGLDINEATTSMDMDG